MRGIIRWVRIALKKRRADEWMSEEMWFHIDFETAANIKLGMTPKEARQAAIESFGGVERFHDQDRTERGSRWLDDLQRDVRIALRGMRRSPGYTIIALAMLALGIGANTAIFSVINAVLIKQLPFEEPASLVQVWESHMERGWDRFSFSMPNAIDVRDLNESFEGVGLMGGRQATMTGEGAPRQINLGTVTPGFFDVLGVHPLQGRTFRETDLDATRAKPVVVLSENLWVARFGADPHIVGQTIEMDTESFLVLGVLPSGMTWLAPDAYVPLVLDPEQGRDNHRWSMVARLRGGVGIESAQAELDALADLIMERTGAADQNMGFRLDPSESWAASDELRRSLWIFMGSAGLLLLIACMNLANLQLARLSARLQQVTLYLALGAGRGRIVRQLLAESAVLGVVGGGLGILVAHFGLKLLIASEPGNVPRMAEVGIDGRVLAFSLVVSLAAGIGAGLLPAIRLTADNLGNALRDAGGKASGGRNGRRIRDWLVGAETALSLVLLVAAGLLIRSLAAVQSVDNGFDSEGRVTFEVPLPASYSGEAGTGFRDEFLGGLRSLPQVRTAAAVSNRPVGRGNTVMSILPKGETPESFGGNISATWRAISDDYFESVGLTVKRGRDLSHQDGNLDVVISESLAKALWPGEDAVGREAELWSNPDGAETVVGVVSDMRERGPEADATLAVYFSYRFIDSSPIHFVVHAKGDPMGVIPGIRKRLAEIDPNVPVSRVRTMDAMVTDSVSSRRFTMTLLGLFAVLALVLALAGLYGVISQSVGQRARELGIRVALGASSRKVVGLVVRQGIAPAIFGIGAGLLAAYSSSRVLESLLFEVSATDPLTYSGVGLLLGLAAACACWIPARATLQMEVSRVLRED